MVHRTLFLLSGVHLAIGSAAIYAYNAVEPATKGGKADLTLVGYLGCVALVAAFMALVAGIVVHGEQVDRERRTTRARPRYSRGGRF